eukprot:1581199-Prorocentrum_lima.AAC.1
MHPQQGCTLTKDTTSSGLAGFESVHPTSRDMKELSQKVIRMGGVYGSTWTLNSPWSSNTR